MRQPQHSASMEDDGNETEEEIEAEYREPAWPGVGAEAGANESLLDDDDEEEEEEEMSADGGASAGGHADAVPAGAGPGEAALEATMEATESFCVCGGGSDFMVECSNGTG